MQKFEYWGLRHNLHNSAFLCNHECNVGSMAGILFAVVCVFILPSDAFDDDDDDVAEFDDGDSDEEPDAIDKKRPAVEEGDSCTDGLWEGFVHCCASSLLSLHLHSFA